MASKTVGSGAMTPTAGFLARQIAGIRFLPGLFVTRGWGYP